VYHSAPRREWLLAPLKAALEGLKPPQAARDKKERGPTRSCTGCGGGGCGCRHVDAALGARLLSHCVAFVLGACSCSKDKQHSSLDL
jgi:hypothetical protein